MCATHAGGKSGDITILINCPCPCPWPWGPLRGGAGREYAFGLRNTKTPRGVPTYVGINSICGKHPIPEFVAADTMGILYAWAGGAVNGKPSVGGRGARATRERSLWSAASSRRFGTPRSGAVVPQPGHGVTFALAYRRQSEDEPAFVPKPEPVTYRAVKSKRRELAALQRAGPSSWRVGSFGRPGGRARTRSPSCPYRSDRAASSPAARPLFPNNGSRPCFPPR
jgi:hypothetical protein